jgi:hypothetical protein
MNTSALSQAKTPGAAVPRFPWLAEKGVKKIFSAKSRVTH